MKTTRSREKAERRVQGARARIGRASLRPDAPRRTAEPGDLAVATPTRRETEAAPNLAETPEQGTERTDNRNMLELYLREIGRVKLITPSEEIELAKRIRAGDEEAREHMIKANLRLVVKIARDYEGLGLPLLDLINEGNIGLMKGVERFNPSKGAKLSTYASWWIKQSIRRALANQSKTIRLPIHVVDKLGHIRRAEMSLHRSLDRAPTDEEVAGELGLSTRRVQQYREASRAPVSLDAPLGDEEDRVAEIVPDTNADAPFDRLVKESDAELVQELFSTLSEREKTVLRHRFGLDDSTPRTLEEVGVDFGLTRERIRQIQEEALQKLRRKMEERERVSRETAIALAE